MSKIHHVEIFLHLRCEHKPSRHLLAVTIVIVVKEFSDSTVLDIMLPLQLAKKCLGEHSCSHRYSNHVANRLHKHLTQILVHYVGELRVRWWGNNLAQHSCDATWHKALETK